MGAFFQLARETLPLAGSSLVGFETLISLVIQQNSVEVWDEPAGDWNVVEE